MADSKNKNLIIPGLDRDIVLQKSLHPMAHDVKLGFVFDALAKGQTSRDIRHYHPHILPSTISIARAYIEAVNGEYFKAISDAQTLRSFSVLIDENLSPRLVEPLSEIFGKVVAVDGGELDGYKDPELWEWAVNNQIDLILTRDIVNKKPDDLSYIADAYTKKILYLDHKQDKSSVTWSNLPILGQFSSSGFNHDGVPFLIKRNKKEIFSYLDNRSTPRIMINGDGVTCQKTYLELLVQELCDQDEYSWNSGPQEILERRDVYIQKIWNELCRRMGPDTVQNWSEGKMKSLMDKISAGANSNIELNM